MTHLVVYYSRTGTTKKLAKSIKRKLDCDEEEIIDKKDRSGVLGFLRASWDAWRGKETEIYGGKKDPSNYDHILIGTPVWAGSPAPAVITYIKKRKFDLDKVSFFCTYKGSGGQKVFDKMGNLCGKKPKSTLGLKSEKIENRRFENDVDEFIGKWLK